MIQMGLSLLPSFEYGISESSPSGSTAALAVKRGMHRVLGQVQRLALFRLARELTNTGDDQLRTPVAVHLVKGGRGEEISVFPLGCRETDDIFASYYHPACVVTVTEDDMVKLRVENKAAAQDRTSLLVYVYALGSGGEIEECLKASREVVPANGSGTDRSHVASGWAVLQSGWEHLLTEWPGNLSAYLHRRYEQDESGSTDDVDRAIELAEMVLAVSESRGDGQVVTALCTLAHPLGGRALATGSTDDLDEALTDFDALLEQIRGKPNFGDFLQIPSRAQMQEAAREGPIVVLTASHYQGVDAILVEENDIRVLPLVGISTADLEECLRSDSDMDSPELLGWLWDSIVEKVLYALGLTEPMPPDELPPRVWWVLTGMVGRFPLHAAGHHSHGSTNGVMDRAVSSYTTSIRALVKAQRDALAPPSKALLISAANTPACRSLRHATDEIKEVGVLLASKDIGSIPLEDAHAGKQKVLGHLAACQIFHYAGHGLEHPSDPLRSALLLHEWKADTMTVSDVLDLNLT
ncbi:hypothetical protein B0T24DRAFT_679694 [Lasiosphaeria ovina]|uniref:CHAT domain-containing protein n=1 Tax=Lasiosphaeria ovina TaxID=92902 RepID=A0AAE0N8V8_9PEZI|nr:hypothetical protein B0T24DRAFT_679694 [Lasiosphaeria ovina]